MNWLGGYTALHCAAERGHKDTVELLINKGANILQTNLFGKNIASLFFNYQSIYLLIFLYIYLNRIDTWLFNKIFIINCKVLKV